MRLGITIAMLEIRNRQTLQSKVNICKSDVKIGDYADSLFLISHLCLNNQSNVIIVYHVNHINMTSFPIREAINIPHPQL